MREAPCKTIAFLGDSLVQGVGCDPSLNDGPALPREVAQSLAQLLQQQVRWIALGETGIDLPALEAEHLPLLSAALEESTTHAVGVDAVVLLCGLADVKKCFRDGQLSRTHLHFRQLLAHFISSVGHP